MEKIRELLKIQGMSTEDIDAFLAEDSEVSVKDTAKAIKEHYRPSFENDQGMAEHFKVKVTGAVLGAKQLKLKQQFGLTKEEVEALPEENRYDAMVEYIVKNKLVKSEAVNEDFAAAQKEIADLKEKVKEYDEKIIPGKEREWSEKNKEGLLKINNLKRLQDKLLTTNKHEVADKMVNSELREKYDFVIDDNGKVVKLLQKGKDLEAFVNNKPISYDDAYDAQLEDLGLIKKSNDVEDKQEILKPERAAADKAKFKVAAPY